jgi:hypothetical protein
MTRKKQKHDYLEMGLLLLQEDDYLNAIKLLDVAIDIDSEFAEAYGFRGFAYYNLGM